MIYSSTLCLLTIQQKTLYRHATPSLSIKYFETENEDDVARIRNTMLNK